VSGDRPKHGQSLSSHLNPVFPEELCRILRHVGTVSNI
jgi:hypothetical protein